MKFSKLNTSMLSLEEKYELIMSEVKDYAIDNPTNDTIVDFLIVLGCRPIPLKSRIIKAAELYEKGYGKYILFSGGHGWNKRVEIGSDKDREMIESVKSMVKPQLIGKTYSNKDRELQEILRRTPEEVDSKIRELSECQLMTRMMITLGGVPSSNIFHEPFSNNTVENMKYTEALFRSITRRGEVPSINSVMIITSSFHCRRAMMTFKKYFKELKILACPTTLDLKERGVRLCKDDILNNDYYRKQIDNELNAIVNYTRNGSIADGDIEEAVGKKIAKEIGAKHQIER